MANITGIQKLALDVYNGAPVMYEGVSGEEALRNAITQACGGDWNIYNFQKNKWDVYQIVSELLTLPTQEIMTEMFGNIVNVETIALGDKKVIDVENQDLFKVATISAGNSDIRRQRVYNRQLAVETGDMGVKLYDDFDRFRAGRINWSTMIDRVRRSIAYETASRMYEALLSAYDSTNANYNVTGTLNEKTLDRMIARVEAKTGLKCALYGTKETLGMVSAGSTSVTTVVHTSDAMRDEYNTIGYNRNYKGTPMMEIPTLLKAGTDDLQFGNELFILPAGLEIIKVVYEGTPYVSDSQDANKRNDRQIEFEFTQKMGVACLISGYFGIYKLQ